ncbi:MAG: hypothetical protein OXN89_11190 [Bryobacterales bacterium]|nr:hypothetical protein [Bryobacterales bacterium]
MRGTISTRILLALGALALAWSTGVPPASAAVDVGQVIESFIDKETEFAKAREMYTYRQKVKILEFASSGSVRGKFELTQDILFGERGKRLERVVFAPPSTLQNLILTPNDMEDLRSVQPFVMTRENAHEYRIDYLGEQQVDEIETYMFSVKPKSMVKGKRYFEGQIWVDQLGLQIVKTYGKGVGILGKKNDEQFPRFETYRDQVDGHYWFPVYTRADDTLAFRSGPQKIRMIITYDNYKRFEGTSVITFGEVVFGDAVEDASPEGQDQP